MKIFIMFLFALLPGLAFSADYQKEIDSFFKLYEKGKIEEAVDKLYGSSPWVKSQPDAMVQMKAKLKVFAEMAGAFHGYEYMAKKEVKGRFVAISYIVLYDRQPVRFIFEFYRPKNEWIIFGLLYDDNIDEDLEAILRTELIGSNSTNK